MENIKPDIQSSFTYRDQLYRVDWYTVTDKSQIPDLEWKQIYMVGDLDGMVPLITNAKDPDSFNLPGGSVEAGESLEQTLKREITEECNMEVLTWEPLGYQVVTEPDGKTVPQFRAYAKVRKIGEFVKDPGGTVIGNTLFPVDQVNENIKYGEVGEQMIKLARRHFLN